MKETSGKSEVRRRSREEAERLVAEFEQSGMSRKGFCVERGISMHTLDYYRRRRGAMTRTTVAQLLPVELVDAASVSSLRVELANGRRIVVERGFDASLLQRVVQALES